MGGQAGLGDRPYLNPSSNHLVCLKRRVWPSPTRPAGRSPPPHLLAMSFASAPSDQDLSHLAAKVVWLSGAASGIGRALALRLASRKLRPSPS